MLRSVETRRGGQPVMTGPLLDCSGGSDESNDDLLSSAAEARDGVDSRDCVGVYFPDVMATLSPEFAIIISVNELLRTVGVGLRSGLDGRVIDCLRRASGPVDFGRWTDKGGKERRAEESFDVTG